MPRLGCFLLALALAACEAPTAPTDRDQLLQAVARWHAHGGDNYTFEITRGCFCVLGGQSVLVTVQDGSVSSAVYTGSNTPVDQALVAYIPTIPDLFDLIQDALDRRVSTFSASYDPTYGYPTSIVIDYSSLAIDDELNFTTRALTLLTPLSGRP